MKTVKLSGNMHDVRCLLICAFRYGLGRRTYIVDDICRLIEKNIDILSIHEKDLIIREIDDASHFNNIGDECDKDTWIKLRNKISETINNDD